MSTTPQRYDYFPHWSLQRNVLDKSDTGPYILFTDHEADKARAVAEVTAENRLLEILQTPSMLRYHVQKQFPEYAWENAEFTGRLRALAEQAATQQVTIARLTKALETIEQWKAFPAIMHRGQTSSYAMAYGSNGERDYMRSIARDALYTPPVIN